MTGLPLWWEGLPESHSPPENSVCPDAADVVIVGGGFTGLWTAYYLTRDHPSLSVVVLEAEHVGFGASGRNGGWVSALFPVDATTLAARHGATAARALLGELRHTVDEIGDVVAGEGFSGVGFVKGGTVYLARNAAQAARARAAVDSGRAWADGSVWLTAGEARERLAATTVFGGTFNPHCARIQPRALVDALAGVVRRRGGFVIEGARVISASPGIVRLADGRSMRARHVIRATEAYSARLARLRRRVAPVYSLIVATEPLPQRVWDTIGLEQREVFSDFRHVVIYGQRTADDRIVFGGRGAPYHFGSAIHPSFDVDERVFTLLRRTITDLLPQLADVSFTHAWGGPLGIPRDWHPSVGYDPLARVGWAGGYVGDGVAASNLAGRTLAELVSGRHTGLVDLPWVGHRSPDWEPEPLRWLGVNAGLHLAGLADLEESWTGRPARLGRLLAAVTAH